MALCCSCPYYAVLSMVAGTLCTAVCFSRTRLDLGHVRSHSLAWVTLRPHRVSHRIGQVANAPLLPPPTSSKSHAASKGTHRGPQPSRTATGTRTATRQPAGVRTATRTRHPCMQHLRPPSTQHLQEFEVLRLPPPTSPGLSCTCNIRSQARPTPSPHAVIVSARRAHETGTVHTWAVGCSGDGSWGAGEMEICQCQGRCTHLPTTRWPSALGSRRRKQTRAPLVNVSDGIPITAPSPRESEAPLGPSRAVGPARPVDAAKLLAVGRGL
ncbi:hypothetical protein K466DRAFT_374893 [Polyporus arcularius HHB13444]|uniref:Uncharacterized protein n=1 Tax=Polyporus arcularius HHB13444 TaxID=1314778 RepID=A0A5C3NVH0_9APHY|nr:hypothetical protein K466DRAFT_374893 [Polyporus arcularius HHB13444]